MLKDGIRDRWVENNLPDDKTFDPAAVKILMRMAYVEGQEQERRWIADEKRKPEGPYEID